MKVAVTEAKPKEDPKQQEKSDDISICTKMVQIVIIVVILPLVVFATFKFWKLHSLGSQVTLVEEKMKIADDKFNTLTKEMRKSQKLTNHIVSEAAKMAKTFNLTEQRKMRSQGQPKVAPHEAPSDGDPKQVIQIQMSDGTIYDINLHFLTQDDIEKRLKTEQQNPKANMKTSLQILVILDDVMNATRHEVLKPEELKKGIRHKETNKDEQIQKNIVETKKSPGFPRRIRRAANSNDLPFDDFWYHYAGDASTSCKVPKKGLKTAEIRCKIWPQSITCNLYCVYGSAFPEGIQRTLNCSFQRNRWSDYFEECQPFVNCKVQLIGPGTLKCAENRVNQSPSCHIGCEEYEDHDATQPRMYDCKADGTWNPPLPPCVAKKSGIDLIRTPNVLEHKNIDFPK